MSSAIDCGSQIVLCELPIRVDTYEGCTHACKYCFVKRKGSIEDVTPVSAVKCVKRFIEGSRNERTNWCDWEIPLHWGGMSDPFQPAESRYKCSLELLKLFSESKYPFVVSSKGRISVTEPYYSLFKKCNCVYQISAVCSKYDKLEPGAPSFEERMEICRKMSQVVRRVIIRVQPYLHSCLNEVLRSLCKFKEAGAYGITIEGMKYLSKKQGLVRLGGDYCYPKELLINDFTKIKKEAHNCGLRFFCAENRLREMGDDWCCCGIEGLKGFSGNKFNSLSISKGRKVEPTKAQTTAKGAAFNSLFQTCSGSRFCRANTVEFLMRHYANKFKDKGIFG